MSDANSLQEVALFLGSRQTPARTQSVYPPTRGYKPIIFFREGIPMSLSQDPAISNSS